MQASARAYRLNQTHTVCKVVFLFYRNTMEHKAVELMSRKQRAAKLLNGEIGLSGLDELTQGEGGLEEALLAAIGDESSLIDPSELFKTDSLTAHIDAEDLNFWNIEDETEPTVLATPPTLLTLDSVLPDPTLAQALQAHLLKVSALPAERLERVQQRVVSEFKTGIGDPTTVAPETLTRWLTKYLRSEKVVSAEHLPALVADLIALSLPQTHPNAPAETPTTQQLSLFEMPEYAYA
jgi:hypothetical protein